MEINQGDVFWFDAGEPRDSSPAYSRPVVVVQNNVFNRSPLGTVLTCALTTNLRRARAPGNVLLDFRVFCFFDEGRLIILTNGFQKKTQKTQKQEIERALKIKKEYYAEKK